MRAVQPSAAEDSSFLSRRQAGPRVPRQVRIVTRENKLGSVPSVYTHPISKYPNIQRHVRISVRRTVLGNFPEIVQEIPARKTAGINGCVCSCCTTRSAFYCPRCHKSPFVFVPSFASPCCFLSPFSGRTHCCSRRKGGVRRGGRVPPLPQRQQRGQVFQQRWAAHRPRPAI